MRIAVFSDDGVHVAPHGGRAGGCLVFHIDGSTIAGSTFRRLVIEDHQCDGRGQDDKEHLGHNHGRILDLAGDCVAVIGGGMGRRLRDDLWSRGIQALTTEETLATRAVEKFLAGSLESSEERICDHHKAQTS